MRELNFELKEEPTIIFEEIKEMISTSLAYIKKFDDTFNKYHQQVAVLNSEINALKSKRLGWLKSDEKITKSFMENVNNLTNEMDRIKLKLKKHVLDSHKKLRIFFTPKDNSLLKMYEKDLQIEPSPYSSNSMKLKSSNRVFKLEFNSFGFKIYRRFDKKEEQMILQRKVNSIKEYVNKMVKILNRIIQYIQIKLERETTERIEHKRNTDTEKYLKKIVNNDLESLFEDMLMDYKNDKILYKQIAILFSRWNEVKMEIRIGVISQDNKNLELNKIKNGLLELINSIR